jgi:sugar lactone lactonase YvrE
MRSAWSRVMTAVLGLGAGLVAPAAPAGSEPVISPGPPVDAPGYHTRYLVEPNPLQQTDGMALDGHGGVWVTQALSNRVVHLDLATLAITRIADEPDAEPIQVPDDIALGPDGNLYATSLLGRAVVRMSQDGRHRKVVGSNIGDGGSGANGIAFRPDGRLFATDLSFSDPSHPGGLWEVDPAGLRPPVPILRNLPTPEGFGFGPDGLAYVPEMFAGRIDVIDVDARTVRPLVDGFGYLVALKVDAAGRLVTMETDTGKLWRVDRTTGERGFVAQGPPGLDNLVIATDGTIYTTNFAQGNVWRVDEARQVMVPLLPAIGGQGSPLALPFSLSEAPDGALVVGDFAAVTRLTGSGDGVRADRLSRLLVDVGGAATPGRQIQLLTPGAVQIGSAVYYSDFLPPDGRIFRRDLATGRRELVAKGFGFPWLVREGPPGRLLVGDQALGAVFDVDIASGRSVPVVEGLRSPSGLAFDRASGVLYVSDTGGGRVLAVNLSQPAPSPFLVATGLAAPEGVAVDGDGTVLVVEGDTGRLHRVDPDGGRRRLVASGLPTRTVGIGLPLLNYSADVLVRHDGTIVVSGDGDGSLIQLQPR